MTLKQFIKLFPEFVFQMLPLCFLMVSLVRFECFTSSLDIEQRGHLSAHASEGQCVEYANCEILAELKIELSVNNKISVNIMVI